MRKERIGSAAAVVMALVFGFTAVGCAHRHGQPIRNETGVAIAQIFTRDTGTTQWQQVPMYSNAAMRHQNVGVPLPGLNAIANGGTAVLFLHDTGVTEAPTAMPNQDILVVDNNGIFYMMQDVPIEFSTERFNMWLLLFQFHTTRRTAETIVFTQVQGGMVGTVTLPFITVLNQTGHNVVLNILPQPVAVASGGTHRFQPMETGTFNLNYTVGNIAFSEPFTIEAEDVAITLTRGPGRLLLQNQTGHPINLTAPSPQPVPPGGTAVFPAYGSFNIAYTSGAVAFTEPAVTVGSNEDVTVALTRAPPTLTLINQVGAAITVFEMRLPGTGGVGWAQGGSTLTQGGVVRVGPQYGHGQVGFVGGLNIGGGAGNAVNIWRGNIVIPDAGNAFDLRVTDINGVQYEVHNIQLTSNMTVTFTQAHRVF